jgi:signal transduction histidine kinase
VRAHGVLRDEEPLGDLVRPEVLVEEEQHLDLAGGEQARDLLGDAARPASLAHAVEQAAGHSARERGIALGDAAKEGRDLLRRLGLQKVARCAAADGREQVLLCVGRSEDDDLGARRMLADAWQRREPVRAFHRQVEEDEVGLQPLRLGDRTRAVLGLADDVEALLGEERGEGVARERMVVHDEHALGHPPLIGMPPGADKGRVDHGRSQTYRSWLLGEIVLVCLLASSTALVATSESLKSAYELHDARLAFDTAIALVATFVCVLTSIRFLVDGRTRDLLLAAGFWSIALGTVAFGLVPVLGGGTLGPSAAWQLVGARLLGAALIAMAPYADGRISARRGALVSAGGGVGVLLAVAAVTVRGTPQSELEGAAAIDGSDVRLAAVLLTGLWLVALVGFAHRYRRHGRDLDSWMCLAATLAFFADLHLVLTPVVSSDLVLQGDFLRVVAYGVLLVGVWKAVGDAEFGRAVADERARVAREIHDGLAQYLFAVSAQVTMLDAGAPLEEVLPRLKRAATSAQQEARFAVLALSSAGGSARFDSALRRYVEVLAADGELDVELDVDPQVKLAPDEQIEVFRIVQEGLGNARRHAGAERVEVSISQRSGRRVVTVSDDGVGFDEARMTSGQGVDNMRVRAAAIEGELTLRSHPGRGTAIEVVLRAA